mgnify:FL=1
MLLCDSCDRGWHRSCLTPPMTSVPRGTLSPHSLPAHQTNKEDQANGPVRLATPRLPSSPPSTRSPSLRNASSFTHPPHRVPRSSRGNAGGRRRVSSARSRKKTRKKRRRKSGKRRKGAQSQSSDRRSSLLSASARPPIRPSGPVGDRGRMGAFDRPRSGCREAGGTWQ